MPPAEHAQLGASGAKRWMNCAGSVRMSEGLPDTAGPHAWEGTAAHEVGEMCLRDGVDATSFVGQFIKVFVGGEDEGEVDVYYQNIEVTQEMADAVQVYVDFVREAAEGGELFIEERVSLAVLEPPRPMFGTTDVGIWFANERLLHVVDYKHGKGVVVEVVDNPQPMYYALGTVVDTLKQKPDIIRMTIVQPRAHHPDGPIRSHNITWDELVAFKKELLTAAEATMDPEAPLCVGDWCRWCPAMATCPAQQEHAVVLAQTEFDVIETVADLPAAEHLTIEELVRVLDGAEIVQKWLKSVAAYALNMLDLGDDVPGYKLVQGRANRQWVDPKEIDGYLARRGLRVKQRYATRKVVSPAQAEKLVKALDGPDLPERFWMKPEGKKTLAPDTDARKALSTSAADDFEEFM